MKTKNNTAYPIVIEWSEEDACFVAHTPAIKYCTAHGETYEEAAREMNSAIEGWVEIARERGTPIPDPGPVIQELQGAAELLNLNEVARRIGIPAQTLYAKVRRGSALNLKESTSLLRTLNEVGIRLTAKEVPDYAKPLDQRPARLGAQFHGQRGRRSPRRESELKPHAKVAKR
jgi:predicted RNase H-like HicB family nuclease